MISSTNKDGDCYCHLWETDPQHLIETGVPEGYCGLCDTEVGGELCGKPGHVRHHPGPYPVTACWCDEHYEVCVDGFNPINSWTLLLGLALLGVGGWFGVKWLWSLL